MLAKRRLRVRRKTGQVPGMTEPPPDQQMLGAAPVGNNGAAEAAGDHKVGRRFMFAGAALFAGEIAAQVALMNTVRYSGNGGNFFPDMGLVFVGIPATAVACALWVWMGSMALAGRGWARSVSSVFFGVMCLLPSTTATVSRHLGASPARGPSRHRAPRQRPAPYQREPWEWRWSAWPRSSWSGSAPLASSTPHPGDRAPTGLCLPQLAPAVALPAAGPSTRSNGCAAGPPPPGASRPRAPATPGPGSPRTAGATRPTRQRRRTRTHPRRRGPCWSAVRPGRCPALRGDHQNRPVLAPPVVLLERHPCPDDLARVRGPVRLRRVAHPHRPDAMRVDLHGGVRPELTRRMRPRPRAAAAPARGPDDRVPPTKKRKKRNGALAPPPAARRFLCPAPP